MKITEQIFQTIIPGPLGYLIAKASDKALISLEFLDEPKEIFHNENYILQQTKEQLEEYFTKKRETFTIPLDPQGTSFQKDVWKVLYNIEFGQTISYKEEANLLNNPKAYRAVANANGKNPISIIIPCHRVIASDGKLGGYTGGLWRKESLLKLEGIVW